MSRILVDSIRSNSASADAITLDGSGNITIPGNATCSGTATGFGIGGKILQVVSSSGNSTITTSGGAITELTNVSITPASASNKVLLIASCSLYNAANGNAYAGAYLYRGTTSGLIYTAISGYGTNADIYYPFSLTIVDSPNTTSAQTYTFSFSRQSINTASISTNGNEYSLAALEIAA